jgi:hypothetical protein
MRYDEESDRPLTAEELEASAAAGRAYNLDWPHGRLYAQGLQQFNDAVRVEEIVELSWWASVNFHVSELDEWRD